MPIGRAVPPSIVESDTSSDTTVDERQKLSLRCRADGYPTPTVQWRREDGKDINQGLYGGKKYSGKAQPTLSWHFTKCNDRPFGRSLNPCSK